MQPEWRRLDEDSRRRGRSEFAAVIDEFAPSVFIKPYSLLGTRGDCDLMLWKAAMELEIFNRIEAELNGTLLGGTWSDPTPTCAR